MLKKAVLNLKKGVLSSFLKEDMENVEWSLSLSGSVFQRMGAANENALTP